MRTIFSTLTNRFRLLFVLMALLPLMSTGCLLFEKQTIHAVYHPKEDVINAVLVYEGLQVGGFGKVTENDWNRAKEDFLDMTKFNSKFYLGNPLIEISLHEVAEALKKETKPENPVMRKLANLIVEHVSLSRGKLFVDEKKLCYSQGMKIQRAGEFVTGVNEVVSMAVIEKAERTNLSKTNLPEWKKEFRWKVLAAAKKRHQWFQLEPGRLNLTFPVNQKAVDMAKWKLFKMPMHDRLRRSLEAIRKGKDVKGNVDEIEGYLEYLEKVAWSIKLNTLSLDHRKDSVTISLGYGGKEPIPAIFLVPGNRQKEGKFQKHLNDLAKDMEDLWDENATVDNVLQAFREEQFPE